ncbi:3D domain-containing protein [Patescibacteria group bacterium]|nr:3D domain-containing protein [Patescibacteria group bacterium]MBU1705493.1 3D domain-containing protein [Patescibacteria group bacterium]
MAASKKQFTPQTILSACRRHFVDFSFVILAGILAFNVIFATAVSADSNQAAQFPKKETVAMMVEAMQNQTTGYGSLPEAGVGQPRWSITVPVTAYSSEPWQTDDTPFITASGTHVRDGIVAANFLPIGTQVRIPEVYGDKVFVVEDRMNPRYYYHLDIWMSQTPEAKNFGRKHLKIEVF